MTKKVTIYKCEVKYMTHTDEMYVIAENEEQANRKAFYEASKIGELHYIGKITLFHEAII